MGLGNIPLLLPGGLPIHGVAVAASPMASYGAMRERSHGKDTTTGHWEMAGLLLIDGFHVFPPGPPSFPDALVHDFTAATGRPIVGNKAASGTEIIEELGARQLEEGCWIAYTSADSVFQIAAHEDAIPLDELYRGCGAARELCNPYRVGRVIARPFVGAPGAFKRTEERRDYSYPLPEPTILDHLTQAGIPVTTVGKLDDVFDGNGIEQSFHVENNPDAEDAVLECARDPRPGLVFANLIDFDMLYGHRRDPDGYARALEKTDGFLGRLLGRVNESDVVIVTADHGNDPTFGGTDHTREYVPLLVYRPQRVGANLGVRDGFYDVAQSLATFFGIGPIPRGSSFLAD